MEQVLAEVWSAGAEKTEKGKTRGPIDIPPLSCPMLCAVCKISDHLANSDLMFHFPDEGNEGAGPTPHSLCLAGPPRAQARCRVLGCWSVEAVLVQNQDWLRAESGMILRFLRE